ncbi:NAD(P)H-dependent oxidoreductase [soil metagenome]
MKLQIIVGSSRPGRTSDRVAKWVATEAKTSFDDVEIIDLKEYTLPFFDELISPQFNPNREATPEVQKWLDKVAEADAYILVTPEYNRSTSAVLKNALDHLDFQFAKKPVGLVGHGSNGGAQAISHLRGIVPAVQAVTVPAVTYFPGIIAMTNSIDENGVLNEEMAANPYGPQTALKTTIADVKLYAEALASTRG